MTTAGQTACLECDLFVTVPTLSEGERADCPRCRSRLTARPRDGLLRSLAFAVSAALFLAGAITFPFLSLKAGGLENVMTLPQVAVELYRNDSQVVAGLVMAFILVLPALLIGAVMALLIPLARGRNAPWLVPAGRLIFALSPWSMVEVFVVGAIVSLVKLASMADVVLGLSFWSYAAFSVCLTGALASLDRLYVWDAIERVSPA